jgi:NADP-dependent 3-hydroxy acid dehydrogenase YdfG
VAITGAGRGIGAAIARDLARSGARLALGDLDVERVTLLSQELGPEAFGHALDVVDEESFRAFLEAARTHFGPVDILINNAGVMWVGPFAEEPDAVARRQFDVNVLGVMHGIKLAAPPMRSRGHGHLITIASAASKLTPRGEAAYAATKHAVYGYCCAVDAELHGTGVAVSIVMPTVVETELAAGTSHGLIRRLTPEDVAAAVHGVILSRRRDVWIPGSIGLLARLLALLPAGAGSSLGRLVVPNQLRKTDRARRRAYEDNL